MEDDLISIIVPIYRVEPYLTECVKSILNQTYRNIEVVLVDDGSPDGCPAICDRYAREDSRVKVVHKANGGLVSARKAGVLASSGQYIGYVDGDDWIEPNMYEKMYESIKKYNAEVVATGHFRNIGENYIIATNGINSGVYNGEILLDSVYPRLIYTGEFYQHGIRVSLWNKLFKRDIILSSQLSVDNEIVFAEDFACVLPALLSAKCIVIDNQPYYHYRQSLGSITKKYEADEIIKLKKLFRYLYRCIYNSAYFKILLPQLRYYILSILLYRCPEIFWNGIYLTPFDCVERNSRIILYGAGDFGRVLYSSIITKKFCEIVLWSDRFAEAYVTGLGLPVSSMELIRSVEYDYVVMAVMNLPEKAKKEITDALINCQVLPEKIIWINNKYIESPELLIRDIILETEK